MNSDDSFVRLAIKLQQRCVQFMQRDRASLTQYEIGEWTTLLTITKLMNEVIDESHQPTIEPHPSTGSGTTSTAEFTPAVDLTDTIAKPRRPRWLYPIPNQEDDDADPTPSPT